MRLVRYAHLEDCQTIPESPYHMVDEEWQNGERGLRFGCNDQKGRCRAGAWVSEAKLIQMVFARRGNRERADTRKGERRRHRMSRRISRTRNPPAATRKPLRINRNH